MSDSTTTRAQDRRERETGKKIRAMDTWQIVDLVHGFEDEIAELKTKLAAAEKAAGIPKYHPCTTILIEGLKKLGVEGYRVISEWDSARRKVDASRGTHD